MSSIDIAVIGAGPAGSWLACLLSQRGARVALVDGSHPREKPCGGGVTGRALSLVRGAIDPTELQAVTIRQARFVGSAEASIPVALGGPGACPLVVASRAHFDGLLLAAAQRAGARVVASRAVALSPGRAAWRVDTADGRSVAAGVIVGADGVNSLVRRRLRAPFRRGQLSIATGYFVPGASGDEILVEFTADPPGYLWSFPRPDHLAVGVCAQADRPTTAGALRAVAADWIARHHLAPRSCLEAYSWPIPSLSADDFVTLAVAGAGWMLVGDAAGLVDPITREGIFFALQSAGFAADALLSEVDRHRQAAAYQDRVRAAIAPELARAARFKARFFEPRVTGLILDALDESAAIRRVMADLVAGTQSYRTLKWRLARTLELSLAWRLLTARNSLRAPAPERRAV